MTAAIALLRALPWQVKAGAVTLVAFALLWTAYSYQKARADRAVAEVRQQRVTTRALDTVAEKTESIRSQQQETERAVDEIQGSDQRLPDGFGAELERLRQRADRADSR
jgi:biopolymer transport protein ExbB/TolQ